MTAAKDYPFILARKTLMTGMQNGDQRSAIEYLKRRDRRYSDKVDNTTKVQIIDEPTQDTIDEALSD